MKSKFINHKGKQIFFADYSNFHFDLSSCQNEVDDATDAVAKEPEKSVLLLVDVRETVGSQEIIDILSASASKIKSKILAAAVVGITGIRKLLMQSVSRLSGLQAKGFDTIDEAKDWLANQE